LFAGRYRKRFEKKGFEPSQKQLLDGLGKAGYKDAKILEIGSGVGHLHQTLLEDGASTAIGVDLASKMVEEARRWAQQRQLTDRVTYLEADFMEVYKSLPEVDVTVLDKVVCCYPDADGLVHASLGKTRRVYALTYPRNRWYVRAAMSVAVWVLKIIGSDFRPYVHDPEMIESWVAGSGFIKEYEDNNLVWLTQVYMKSG